MISGTGAVVTTGSVVARFPSGRRVLILEGGGCSPAAAHQVPRWRGIWPSTVQFELFSCS